VWQLEYNRKRKPPLEKAATKTIKLSTQSFNHQEFCCQVTSISFSFSEHKPEEDNNGMLKLI
jgi:hypothetical protein